MTPSGIFTSKTELPAPIPGPAAVILVSREELLALLEEASARGAARALSQAPAPAAPRTLNAKEAAARYTGGSLAKWRNRRADHPSIDEEAGAGGSGKSRRWDAAKLEQVMRELGPKMRRRAKADGGGGA